MQTNRILISICVVLLVMLFSSATKVYGAAGYFGTQERIKCIQALDAEAPERPAERSIWTRIDNRPKYGLCYKYTILFFFAGVYLHDDGYVLAEGDEAYRYVPLDGPKMTEFQEKGLLPKDLPPYSIPFSQYVIGYSLWLILVGCTGGVVLWRGFKRLKNKGKYCLKCDLILIENDIKAGRCGNCGEPIPG